ncbi:Chitinase 2 [Coemansia sp. RSA 2320]|nr:Chitinase 2 [Coemansia sp. RSA 2320]
MNLPLKLLGYLAALAGYVTAFNVNCNSNYASYYGQNSAGNQKTLGSYCQDATEDVIVLAFMNGFPNVMLNFANACETTFSGSSLLHCPSIAADIKYCQSQGKAVVLSMGGASGSYGFSSDAQGSQFADTVWDMFFKGSAAQRPFDDAVLDGIDLDIEGGSTAGYAAFISQLRTHYASDPSKQYYIASAPQCPFPDAYLGSSLNSAWFDMVFVQFYNNYCGVNAYPTWFNFADWDNWAKTQSVNKNVRVFIGVPGSPSAASSGYIDGSSLNTIYSAVRSNYSSLGGIMTWDLSKLDELNKFGECIEFYIKAMSIRKRLDLTSVSAITAANLRPKPASAIANIPTRVEFVAGEITDNKYTMVVKIQANKSAFTGNWQISFTLPSGQTANSTSRGYLGLNGNTITVNSNRNIEWPQNMAAVFKITGTFTDKYALPNTSSAVFVST